MTGEYTRAELARMDERLQQIRETITDVAQAIRDLATQAREREHKDFEADIAKARELATLTTRMQELEKKHHKVANAVSKLESRVGRLEQATTAPRPIVPANSEPKPDNAGEVAARTKFWQNLAKAAGALATLALAAAAYLATR